MSGSFDPYHKWLGIAPKDQPPNHYRLLGVERFEDDREVIDAAASRVLSYLKELAAGDDEAHSQRLMNEVIQARICLLNPKQRARYDVQLRAKPAATRPPPRAKGRHASAPSAATAAPASAATAAFSSASPLIELSPRSVGHALLYSRTRRRSLNAILIGSSLIAFGAALLLVFFLLGKGGGDDEHVSESHPSSAKRTSESGSADSQRLSQGGDRGEGMHSELSGEWATESDHARVAREGRSTPDATERADSNANSGAADPGKDEQEPRKLAGKREHIAAVTNAETPDGQGGSEPAMLPTPEPLPPLVGAASAERALEERFGTEIDLALTDHQQMVTARRLLVAASDPNEEAAERLALLLESQRLALAAGDVQFANDVLDRLARDFTIPGVTDDASGWDAKAAILLTLSVRARTSEEAATRADAALAFAESAACNGRLDLARSIVAMAVGQARKARNVELFRQATLLYLNVQDGRL